MTIKSVYYSSHFKRKLKKYSLKQQKIIKLKLAIFIKTPFDPELKTHKLTGKFKYYWSFSVSYRKRILFEFIDKDSVGLIDIGGHDIYK